MADAQRIGFIGLGIMGAPMAANLIADGYQLTVCNRTHAKAERFAAEHGATAVRTPREVAAASDVVISIVSDTPDMQQVLVGDEGVVQAAREGMLAIDMSTVSPEVTREVAATLGDQGVALVDAPVSGGEAGAKSGGLTIMAGGTAAAFERARPLFEVMGKTINHMGPVGSGQQTKLVNQIVASLNLLAVCEGLVFAAKAGLDLPKVVAALSGGSAQSFFVDTQAPKIIARDFAPGFFVSLEQKDLRLVLEAARSLGVSLPGVSVVQQLYNAVERLPGAASQAHISLVRALEALAGQQVGEETGS